MRALDARHEASRLRMQAEMEDKLKAQMAAYEAKMQQQLQKQASGVGVACLGHACLNCGFVFPRRAAAYGAASSFRSLGLCFAFPIIDCRLELDSFDGAGPGMSTPSSYGIAAVLIAMSTAMSTVQGGWKEGGREGAWVAPSPSLPTSLSSSTQSHPTPSLTLCRSFCRMWCRTYCPTCHS